jgi:hypothetical protein
MNAPLRFASLFSSLMSLAIALISLSGCEGPTAPNLNFVYDDFGPPSVASELIGAKGNDTHVIARFGSTHSAPPASGPDVRYVSIEQAMNFLRRSVHRLPHTEEGNAQHQRMSATYARLYRAYSSRRNAVMGAPFGSYGRGGINRAFIYPPMAPSI